MCLWPLRPIPPKLPSLPNRCYFPVTQPELNNHPHSHRSTHPKAQATVSPELKLSLKMEGVNPENYTVRPEHHAWLQQSPVRAVPRQSCDAAVTVGIAVCSWCLPWGTIDPPALNIPAAFLLLLLKPFCGPRQETGSSNLLVPMHWIFSALKQLIQSITNFHHPLREN